MLKAAIYHFTNTSEKRPKIYINQLNLLEKYATSLGFTVTEIFCDKSLLRCEHPEFNRFLLCCENFDALIAKDFYHISKNTMKCMSIMKTLRDNGVKIYTPDNGSYSWDNAPFDEPLRVATYGCHFGTPNEMKHIIPVQNDILALFTTKKTHWSITGKYFDKSKHQNDGEQVQLMSLIQNKAKYDLLLVHNLNDIHWRTSNFCKIREQLQLDIYSLQDGFIKYERE